MSEAGWSAQPWVFKGQAQFPEAGRFLSGVNQDRAVTVTQSWAGDEPSDIHFAALHMSRSLCKVWIHFSSELNLFV